MLSRNHHAGVKHSFTRGYSLLHLYINSSSHDYKGCCDVHFLSDLFFSHCILRIFSALLERPAVVSVCQTRSHSPSPTSAALQSGGSLPTSLFKCPFGNFSTLFQEGFRMWLTLFRKVSEMMLIMW